MIKTFSRMRIGQIDTRRRASGVLSRAKASCSTGLALVVPISLVEIIEAMNARLSGADSEVGRVVEHSAIRLTSARSVIRM